MHFIRQLLARLTRATLPQLQLWWVGPSQGQTGAHSRHVIDLPLGIQTQFDAAQWLVMLYNNFTAPSGTVQLSRLLAAKYLRTILVISFLQYILKSNIQRKIQIRTQPTTILEIFFDFFRNSEVRFKGLRNADDTWTKISRRGLVNATLQAKAAVSDGCSDCWRREIKWIGCLFIVRAFVLNALKRHPDAGCT